MRELLDRRPDRPLPRHDRLRAELLDAIDNEPVRTPHRGLVPVVAAAAVLVIAAGAALVVPGLKNDDAQVAGQASIRELSADETAALHQQCLAEADRITVKQLPKPFRKYQPVRAFEFTAVKDPRVVNTWFIAKGTEDQWQDGKPSITPPGQGYWLCSRTAGGVISESSIRMSARPKVTQQVWPLARNAGYYAGAAKRVTVQPKGQPERDAYLSDGFWFAPTVGRVGWGPYDSDDPGRADFVVRGYGASGSKLYDSSVPPQPQSCVIKWNTPGAAQWHFTDRKTGQVKDCPAYPWPNG